MYKQSIYVNIMLYDMTLFASTTIHMSMCSYFQPWYGLICINAAPYMYVSMLPLDMALFVSLLIHMYMFQCFQTRYGLICISFDTYVYFNPIFSSYMALFESVLIYTYAWSCFQSGCGLICIYLMHMCICSFFWPWYGLSYTCFDPCVFWSHSQSWYGLICISTYPYMYVLVLSALMWPYCNMF